MKKNGIKKKITSLNKESQFKQKIFNGKIIILISSIIVLFTIIAISNFNNKTISKTINLKTQNEEWITVFTHGSFGSLLGLINFSQVFEDKVAGTKYKKIINKMRKNPIFYRNQPILQKGLIKIEPTFDLQDTLNNKFAAYPLLNIYKLLQKQTNPNENNHFYTFGWSGLISQKRRRKEAIRFYNALSEEIKKYNKKGIYPKIRILTHSHGGNLALNLAAVKTIVKNIDNFNSFINIIQNKDEQESLKLMFNQINKLSPNKNSIKKKGQKKLDYIPEKKDLIINELIMFGTPIQPETECFVLNKIFRNIYNIYSEEDVVQEMDFVSTKKGHSDQRLTILNKIDSKELKSNNYPKITQLKIMVGHKLKKKLSENNQEYKELTINSMDGEKNQQTTFWSKLFSKDRFFSKKTKDPTHKELWFFNWCKSDYQDHLEILPTVVFTPLIKKAIKNIIEKNFNDIDLNLDITKEKLNIYVFKHNNPKVENSISINKNLLDQIKPQILLWKPDESAYSLEFEAIKEYNSSL